MFIKTSMEFIDKICSVELKPTLQLGHHPPLSPTGGVSVQTTVGGVCLNWNVWWNYKENIKYEGDFIEDKYEGNGKYTFKSGEYYIGEWKNNLRHGKGKFYHKNGIIQFEGDYVNDFPEYITLN